LKQKENKILKGKGFCNFQEKPPKTPLRTAA